MSAASPHRRAENHALQLFKHLKASSLAAVILSIGCLLPVPANAASVKIDASEQHLVRKGDTLWGIATLRYKNPWKWKEIWALNKKSIKNPHWIYPGQVFALVNQDKQKPHLTQAKSNTAKPVAAAPTPVIQPAPALPASAPVQPAPVPVIAARIISVYTGTSQSGNQVVVILDKGQRDGVENGFEMALFREESAGSAQDAASAPSATAYGQARIFRTFKKTAYAAVIQADQPVKLLDWARK